MSHFIRGCSFMVCPQTHAVKVQESLAKSNSVATETFSSIKTVKSFANEDGESERYRKCLERTYSLNKVEAAGYAASTWTNSVRLIDKSTQSFFILRLVSNDFVDVFVFESFPLFFFPF